MSTQQPPTPGGSHVPPEAPAGEAYVAPTPGTAPPEVPAYQLAPAPVAPPPVNYGVVYCRGCGQPINPQAAVCMSCGVATAQFSQQLRPANPKTKSTAVILVVLFGVFGWIYTYQRDAWKFWLNLGLTVVTIGIWGVVAWIWSIVDMAVRPSSFYEGFPNA